MFGIGSEFEHLVQMYNWEQYKIASTFVCHSWTKRTTNGKMSAKGGTEPLGIF